MMLLLATMFLIAAASGSVVLLIGTGAHME
jgi:hypothetical protein